MGMVHSHAWVLVCLVVVQRTKLNVTCVNNITSL
jgi:hypothetical protein